MKRSVVSISCAFTLALCLCYLRVFRTRTFSVGKASLSRQVHTPIKRLRTTCGVMTTILEVNDAVTYIAENLNISLVVVGDKKTDHTEWSSFQQRHSDVAVYLSPFEQKRLPFLIRDQIPWNHFGRKSLGFMYAIAGGCEQIYDFDDDNHMKGNHSFDIAVGWKLKNLKLKQNSLHVFNPYPYFQPTQNSFIWPRGFPLQFIRDRRTYDLESTDSIEVCDGEDDSSRLAVVQSLADHDPDVDAIYRMTRPLPMYFERNDTILVLPRALYTPWNAQAVLVRKSAFFGLLLPVTVTGRVSDIWRSYVTSRLLWETRYQIGFSSSFVTQYRNPHSYMVDFTDEHDLYNKVDDLLTALASWSSHGFDTLEEAYLNMISKLVFEAGILGVADLRLAKAWVLDLKSVGYVWPEIHVRLNPMTLSTSDIVDQRHLG